MEHQIAHHATPNGHLQLTAEAARLDGLHGSIHELAVPREAHATAHGEAQKESLVFARARSPIAAWTAR
jgi:hypothetical protein